MATYYIDPTVSPGGTGTQTDPFDDWGDVTFVAGDTYLQVKETTADEFVEVDVSGTADDPITLRSSSSGSTAAISGGLVRPEAARVTASFVTVEDLNFKDGAVVGLDVRGDTGSDLTDITIKNCVANDISAGQTPNAAGKGVGFYQSTVDYTDKSISNVTYEDCVAINNSKMGFDTQAPGLNNRWIRCTAKGNGFDNHGGGFFSHPWRLGATGWSLVSGTVYERDGLSDNDDVDEVFWEDNFSFLTETASSTPGVGEFYYNTGGISGAFRVNVGVDANTQVFTFRRRPLKYWHWIECLAEGNKEAFDSTHGSGFQLDDLTTDSFVTRCRSIDNEGDGIMIYMGQRNVVSCSLALRNGSQRGYNVINSQSYDTQFNNLTVLDSIEAGILTGVGTVAVSNCISVGNWRGLQASNPNAVMTATNCLLYNNTEAILETSGGVVNDTGTITQDPLFVDAANEDYTLQPASPAVGAGVKWWGDDPRPETLNGEPLPDLFPDLGAYQSTHHANHPVNL